MASTIEEATIPKTLSEVAHDIALQNALFESSPKLVHGAQNCLALRNFDQFLQRFSPFNTIFRCFHYQKLILMQNKHDIQNQHKKLHPITYISNKYFFQQNSTCTPPQLFILKFHPVVPHGWIFAEKNIYLKYTLSDVVFCADSEYHVYFAPESAFDSQHAETQY